MLKLFNWNDIQCPVTLKDIDIFEKNNIVAVNVYALDKDNHIYPIRVSKNYKIPDEKVWDLLILRDEIKTHFTYIKDFSRLVRRQICT